MDGSQGGIEEAPLEPAAVRRFLSDNPEFLTGDDGLLNELGLKVAAGNVVDFGPAALARVHAAHQREATQRIQIEETARANFSAQAQTHASASGVTVFQGKLDIRDTGTFVREKQLQSLATTIIEALQCDRAASPIVQNIAGEFARGGDDLGLVYQTESEGDRMLADDLAHADNVFGRLNRKIHAILRSFRCARRGGAAEAPCLFPRLARCAHRPWEGQARQG